MNKRILTSILATAAIVFGAAVGSYATPLDHIVPEGAPEPVALTEEQYKQFKFEWTDAAGVKHTSDVTERATDPNHIVALIKEVYTNPQIPGFVYDRAYDLMVASAERDPNGAYYLQLRNAAGQLVLDHEPTEPAYEGKLEFTLPSEAFSDLSHHLTLVIRDVKGNSYGTDARTIVDIPTLEMEPVSAFYTINDNPANLYLETKADWSLAAPEGWTVEAIRFWAHHTTETVINPAPADFSNIANAGWLSGSEPTLALDNTSLGTEGSRKYGITVSKDGLTNYNVSHGMRAYVRIPDTYVADANHTAGTPAYFVVDASGSSTATGDNVQTGIDGIEATPEAEAEYYTLHGIRVSKADLTPGVYIERRGGKARKIMVK